VNLSTQSSVLFSDSALSPQPSPLDEAAIDIPLNTVYGHAKLLTAIWGYRREKKWVGL
jgi:hypothetical protein